MSLRASASFVFGRLLGAHVVDRAHHLLGRRQAVAAVFDAGQAHVENLDDALLVEQQVGRLDVAMDRPLRRARRPARGPLAAT